MRMCPCFKEVPSYLSGFSAVDFRTAASAGVGRLSACLVKQSFNVKNNLAELAQSGGDLSEADGDKIIRAPTVGLDLYISLSQSGANCAGGVGSSECTTVISLLLNYFKNASSTVGTGLAEWMEEYVVGGAIDSVVDPLGEAKTAASPLAALQTQLKSCAAGAQGNTAVANTQAAVTQLQQAVAALDKQVTDAKTAQQSVTTAVQGVRAMADAAGKSYEKHLVDAVQGLLTGDLSGTFVDLIGFMGKSDDVTNVFTNVQTSVTNLQQLQSDIDAVETAVTKAQTALTGAGSTCKTDGGASLTAIESPLETARGAAASVQSRLGQLKADSLEPDVATVKHFIELPVDLPCLQMGSVTIGDVQDGTEDVPVPQFKMCRGSNLPMPNEFIPYIRIKGGAAK